MDTNEPKGASLAVTWIVCLNLLIACAAQIAATLALLQDLAIAAGPR